MSVFSEICNCLATSPHARLLARIATTASKLFLLSTASEFATSNSAKVKFVVARWRFRVSRGTEVWRETAVGSNAVRPAIAADLAFNFSNAVLNGGGSAWKAVVPPGRDEGAGASPASTKPPPRRLPAGAGTQTVLRAGDAVCAWHGRIALRVRARTTAAICAFCRVQAKRQDGRCQRYRL